MKHSLLAILIFGFFTDVIGQDWAPFYAGDTCIYRNDTSEFFAHTVWVDSVGSSADGVVWRLNPSNHLCDTCDVERYCGKPPLLVEQPFPFGSTIRLHDSSQYIFDQGGQGNMLLLAGASPGTTWLMDTVRAISAMVFQVVEDSVWGQPDSIKVIHLSTGDSILLSKQHGMVSFPDSISRGLRIHLAGILNKNLGEGIIDFWDIYDYQVGDVLFYDSGYGISGTYWDTKSKVTILSKHKSQDTMLFDVLTKARTETSSGGGGGNIYGDDSIAYTWKFINQPDRIVNALPNQIQISEDQGRIFAIGLGNWKIPMQDTNHIAYVRNSRTLKEASGIYSNDSIPIYGCSSSNIPDLSFPFFVQLSPFSWSISVRYEKGLGQTLYGLRSFEGGAGFHLVGYIRDGDTVGTVYTDEYLFVGTKDELSPGSILIFPNPARESLVISLTEPRFLPAQARIWDLYGRVVLTESLSATETTIQLPDIPTGLYYVEVVSPKGKILLREKVQMEQ